jgi:hypothetical protein
MHYDNFIMASRLFGSLSESATTKKQNNQLFLRNQFMESVHVSAVTKDKTINFAQETVQELLVLYYSEGTRNIESLPFRIITFTV